VDIDGNQYPVVQIGAQIWMAENLRATRYQDGTSIPYVLSDADWQNATSGAWCYYNHDATMNIPFGKLYNGYVAADSKNVCPTGWRVPGREDWQRLKSHVDSRFGEYSGALLAYGVDFWLYNGCVSMNATGFNAVGAGMRFRYSTPFFSELKAVNVLWHNDGYYAAGVSPCSLQVSYLPFSESCFSIRCIKN
jgi:uncharacterized protein (TIGR02145 family)